MYSLWPKSQIVVIICNERPVEIVRCTREKDIMDHPKCGYIWLHFPYMLLGVTDDYKQSNSLLLLLVESTGETVLFVRGFIV
jgi:hypothetical protein